MELTLLGPQRRPTVDRVLTALGVTGRVATVTAGWRDREPEVAELHQLVGGDAVDLALYRRWLSVLEADRDYARAERQHRLVLADVQQLYLTRVAASLDALMAVAQHTDGNPRAREMAVADAMETVRQVDARHLSRVVELEQAFQDSWRPAERDAAGSHRAEVAAALADCRCLVIAGGHVADLRWVFQLLLDSGSLPERVVAWSAGAMALTERIVLFHDWSAGGPGHPEVLAPGAGLVSGLVLLPHARRRLRVDDAARMSRLAQRFWPSRCLVLDDGVRVDLPGDGQLPRGARVVEADGQLAEVAG